jgi:hypothetical protein
MNLGLRGINMEKLNMKTKDLTQENISKLTSLFPELLTELEKDGKLIKTKTFAVFNHS